ncbi:MAG TPA: glycosyltransferase [Caulobacteraceae bacterium]
MDSVIARLTAVGAPYDPAHYDVRLRRFGEPGGRVRPEDARRFGQTPKVSCLMVTRGRLDQVAFAIRAYAAQTWAQRELVVVAPAATLAGIETLAAQLGALDIVLFAAPQGVSLGDLRNFAIARARGDVMLQWDDDDLYDPLRIELTMSVMLKTDAAAVFLERWLLWWPARRLAGVSNRRVWEGSIAVWRAHATIYPALQRGEDTPVLEYLAASRQIVLFDAPLQYVYAVTGRNTWDAAHFERQMQMAETRFEGDEYDALNQLLAQRLPIFEYERYLLARAAEAEAVS